MAAYAALVSVMHIIDTIEHHHSPPISIDKQQVESLTRIVTSLQEFLEGYKSPVADGDEADPLEMRIADAAYKAEDVIESHIVDKLQPRRSKRIADAAYAAEDAIESHIVEKLQLRRSKRIADAAYKAEDAIESHIVDKLQLRRSKKAKIDTAEADEQVNFYQDLQQVIEEMNVIKKEAMESSAEAQLQRKVSSTRAGSLTSSSTVKESMMVGFDDVVLQLLDRLTGGNRNRQIIPITGMGGIGWLAGADGTELRLELNSYVRLPL